MFCSGLRAGWIINFFRMLPVAPLEYIWTEIFYDWPRVPTVPRLCSTKRIRPISVSSSNMRNVRVEARVVGEPGRASGERVFLRKRTSVWRNAENVENCWHRVRRESQTMTSKCMAQ